MSVLNNLLTEKLRPKKFADVLLLDRIKKSIKNGEHVGQHLLFTSSPGTGKTSCAKVIAQDYPNLYINISSDRGIDTVREEIVEFCSTQSLGFEDKTSYKILILDELEGATPEFFKAMRATMEKFSENVRFIATSNSINKIPEPIQSRFLVLNFNPENSSEEKELFNLYKQRILKITETLKISWENKELVDEFINKFFPDLRSIIVKIQDFYDSEEKLITRDKILYKKYFFENVYKLIVSKPNPIENYKTIMKEFKNKENEIILSLVNEFPEWFQEKYEKQINKLPQIVITIADWDYKKNFMVDKILGLLALIYQCQTIFNN